MGISLLGVAGKLLARIIQDHLPSLVEDTLPNSQCKFRSGRGCIDMMFVARQLMEKSIEHESDLYILFVDHHKAYDSVTHLAVWKVMERLNVPQHAVFGVLSTRWNEG